jgi:hypothetical protein
MEALDIAAFGSFVALALAWVILPLRAPVATPVAPVVPLEAAA